MKFSTWAHGALVSLFVVASVGAQASDTLSTDFESMPTGNVLGGTDSRTADDGQFWTPDNAATYGTVKDGIGLGASRGLEIGNRGNGNDGVIHGVQSSFLSESAGESTVSPNDTFTTSYWFRTAPDQATAGLRFRSESWGPDRDTFFAVNGEADGSLEAYAYGMQPGAATEDDAFVFGSIASGLNWGEWYRVETTIHFLDGAGNDTVSYGLYDSSSTLLGSASLSTWEQGQREWGYNGGNIFGVDRVSFQSRGGFAGANAYVDNLSYGAVPEPMSMMVLGGMALFGLKRRKK